MTTNIARLRALLDPDCMVSMLPEEEEAIRWAVGILETLSRTADGRWMPAGDFAYRITSTGRIQEGSCGQHGKVYFRALLEDGFPISEMGTVTLCCCECYSSQAWAEKARDGR